eukprot:5438139-Lingulodinium_polyedra.AAC.1
MEAARRATTARATSQACLQSQSSSLTEGESVVRPLTAPLLRSVERPAARNRVRSLRASKHRTMSPKYSFWAACK